MYQTKLSEPKFLSLMSPPRRQGHEPRGLALLWHADATFSWGCDGLSSSHSPSQPCTHCANTRLRVGKEGRNRKDRSGCQLEPAPGEASRSGSPLLPLAYTLLRKLCLGVMRWNKVCRVKLQMCAGTHITDVCRNALWDVVPDTCCLL